MNPITNVTVKNTKYSVLVSGKYFLYLVRNKLQIIKTTISTVIAAYNAATNVE